MSTFTNTLLLYLLVIALHSNPCVTTPTKASDQIRQLTGEWASCSGVPGLCIDISSHTCSTPTLSLKCPGGATIRCCPSPAGISTPSCNAWESGLCKRSTDCSTHTQSGLCPGPSGVLCCANTPAETPSFEWLSCNGGTGLCIDVDSHSCEGGTVTGLCSGPANIRCCPASTGVISSPCLVENGLCKGSTDCLSSTLSGLCPGPSDVRCCVDGNGPSPAPAGDVSVTPGIYLLLNPPARSQWRSRGTTSVRPVIVVHTAESAGTAVVPDLRAESTANFIRTRSTPGCYHIIGDTDSIIQLVSFSEAAFHDGTGSNDWSIGISLAVRAADWTTLDVATRDQLVVVMAQMAAIAAEYLETQGLTAPTAVLLTKAESDLPDASGFISHALRDPTRRTDPGADFPWSQFFHEYNLRI